MEVLGGLVFKEYAEEEPPDIECPENKMKGQVRVLHGHQGYKVLAVIAEHNGVSVAFLGRPVKRQVNPTHLQRSKIGT